MGAGEKKWNEMKWIVLTYSGRFYGGLVFLPKNRSFEQNHPRHLELNQRAGDYGGMYICSLHVSINKHIPSVQATFRPESKWHDLVGHKTSAGRFVVHFADRNAWGFFFVPEHEMEEDVANEACVIAVCLRSSSASISYRKTALCSASRALRRGQYGVQTQYGS